MGWFASYPYRGLADRIHALAPILEPEVKGLGRDLVLGARISPTVLLLVQLRRKAGWWVSPVYYDLATGEPSEGPATVMAAMNQSHQVPVQAHEITGVALHVVGIARTLWAQTVGDVDVDAGEHAYAVEGLRQLRASGFPS